MSNLENLYRQIIIEHYKYPRNKGLKGHPHVRLVNSSCGDDITVEANIVSDILEEINFDGVGCSICCASASILTDLLRKQSVQEANNNIQKFYSLVKGEDITDEDLKDAMVFQGVSKFPARVKCATLPWKALESLIKGNNNER